MNREKGWWSALPPLLAVLLAGGCSCGKSTEDLPAVTGIDAARYLGRWHEIARLPHRFERGTERVTAEYTPRPDGSIRVVNRGVRDGRAVSVEGVAEWKGDRSVGELRVSFFRPFWGDYRIIRLAPDYRYAVVTGATRDYFWILARTPRLPDAELQTLLAEAEAQGFAVDRLEFPAPETAP